MHLLESHNFYPDCVSIALKTIPVQSDSTDSEQFDLYLNLEFNEQRTSLLEGYVQFGLKGGELRLKLENTEIAITDDNLRDSLGVTVQPSLTNPSWIFTPKLGESGLKGGFKQVKLGRITIISKPCFLTATLEVSPPDISLTDAEGLWKHDISPNKHGVLERKLALFWLENQFKPYLSVVKLGSGEFEQSLPENRELEITSEKRSQLQNLIQRIYEAETDKFLELAKLANLNPLKDLAGANLLATELSGVELSGANLYQVNLRGSVLTDADLSEANLSYAKLSGADLSGAYLGNANLSHTDLHRASLALANLIGADLSRANLKEANLTNANLSGAKVEKSKFGGNPGISDQTKLDLQQRGAIFE